MIKEFEISTTKKKELINITSQIQALIKDAKDGVVTVFTPHTTAAITINENADPDVCDDILMKLEKISKDSSYAHSEGNSDSHLISSLIGCSEQIIVKNGKLILGTWQGVYFLEFDGPRTRKVFVQF